MQELQVSSSSHFLTLTYDTRTVPISRCGRLSLDKQDFQLFMKRLRKCNPDTKLKYYAVGEYGSESFRPHYHLLLFNSTGTNHESVWNKGLVHYGDVSPASIGYCLKYMFKRGRIPVDEGDHRVPEFALISKGIGTSYLTKNMHDWHKADLAKRAYLNLKGGEKIAMPRYYKEKLYSEEEKAEVAYANKKRQELEREKLYKQLEQAGTKLEQYWHFEHEAIRAEFERSRIKSLEKLKL